MQEHVGHAAVCEVLVARLELAGDQPSQEMGSAFNNLRRSCLRRQDLIGYRPGFLRISAPVQDGGF